MSLRALVLAQFLFLNSAVAATGDEENKLQEEALEISVDNGKDSPEFDEFQQKNELKDEELLDLEEGPELEKTWILPPLNPFEFKDVPGRTSFS